MSSRSLNRVQLIGNLTRDPELRYTPNGAAVCQIGLATNRSWTTDAGERKEETEFHRVVAWNKLAELCSQLLTKGRKVYVEGRLRTTTWQAQDGSNRYTTEIVIDDMILLDPRRPTTAEEGMAPDEMVSHATPPAASETATASGVTGAATSVAQPALPTHQRGEPAVKKSKKSDKTDEEKPTETGSENVNPDDIPF